MQPLDMAMSAIIPPWVKPVLIGLAVSVALGGAAAGGATVNGWRLNAEHQREMTAEKARYDDLNEKVLEQNRAVAALAASKQAADDRRKLAEGYAASLLTRINNRDQAVASSTAVNCDGVLKEAWGNWR